MTEQTLEVRIAKLEAVNDGFLPKSVKEMFAILSPIIVVVLGFYFSQELGKTSETIERNELELRRIEVTQSMLAELFDGEYAKAAAMKQLLSRIIQDEELSIVIGKTVDDYLKSKIEAVTESPDEFTQQDLEEIREITKAGEQLQVDVTSQLEEVSKVYVVVQSLLVQSDNSREESIADAKKLIEAGFEGAEVWLSETGEGYFALTMGHLPATEARALLDAAIAQGLAVDGYLTKGKHLLERVWPEND